jgi:hypothetical protein
MSGQDFKKHALVHAKIKINCENIKKNTPCTESANEAFC